MYKKLFGALFGAFVIWCSTLAFSQCGAMIKQTTQNCGVHCGSVVMQSCQGVGTLCEDGTGEFGFGCCGLQLIEPGSCQSARTGQPQELPPSREFLALKDALALRKRTLPAQNQLMIASCGPNKNAFSEWLEAKLKKQRAANQ
ncbi:MAG TPA: hypothetical protein VFB79_11185 [Candidatus Angelobacter sp.]|nr:hypothetical protein [Candidatus Angelobacter sp.]